MTDSASVPLRRLAAVLLADVAGYSRMMERDDTGTHLRLREIRARIIEPALQRHRGRPIRSKGDDLLVEFGSATDALACAVQIQRALLEHNDALPSAQRMELRIGINLGDILIDEADIAGDGVNVAARLQGLAAPGGIAISAAVREQVRQITGIKMSDAGEFSVKNISRPIRVFRVHLGPDQRPWIMRLMARLKRRRRLLAAVAAAASVIAATSLLWPRSHDAAPDLQSTAVVVVGAGGGAGLAAQALSVQLPEALRQGLGPDVRVVAADAVAVADNDIKALGRTLNARFVLKAAVAEQGEQVRVTASLTAADSNAQLWSDSIEAAHRSAEKIPAEIVAQLVHAALTHSRRHELQRLAPVEQPSPALRVLRAEEALAVLDMTVTELRASAERYGVALQAAPRNVRALTGATESWAMLANRTTDETERRQARQRAEQLSSTTITVSPNDGEAWRVRALALLMNGKLDSATEAIEHARRLYPQSSDIHALRGLILANIGRPEEAIAEFDAAIRLAPTALTVGQFLYLRARAMLLQGRYRDASESAFRSIAFLPEWPDYMILAAANAMLGETQKAEAAKQELLRLRPDFRIHQLTESLPLDGQASQQREQHLLEGLRRAGLPD